MEYVELKIKTRKKYCWCSLHLKAQSSSIELNSFQHSYLIDDFMAHGCCYSDLIT